MTNRARKYLHPSVFKSAAGTESDSGCVTTGPTHLSPGRRQTAHPVKIIPKGKFIKKSAKEWDTFLVYNSGPHEPWASSSPRGYFFNGIKSTIKTT
jgi:hypothetical protein